MQQWGMYMYLTETESERAVQQIFEGSSPLMGHGQSTELIKHFPI